MALLKYQACTDPMHKDWQEGSQFIVGRLPGDGSFPDDRAALEAAGLEFED